MRISDWSSDVCSSDLIKPERPEIGVETATNAGAEPPIGKFRRGAFVNLPRIDKAHNAEIAKPIAHFSRCLIQAAATDRIAVRILRPQLLLTHAANRPAPTALTHTGRPATGSGHPGEQTH